MVMSLKLSGRFNRRPVRRALTISSAALVAVAFAPLTHAGAAPVGTELSSTDSPTTRSFGSFGQAVAVSGSTVVVGDPGAIGGGAAYVYQIVNNALVLQQTLVEPAEPDGTPVQFGRSVSISGNTIVVGDPFEAFGTYPNVTEPGGAFIFTGTTSITGVSSNFTFTERIVAPAQIDADAFGFSVSIGSSIIAVGALSYPSGGHTAGAAFLFTKSTSGYETTPSSSLYPADGTDGDYFGWQVSLGSSLLAVGSPHHGVTGAAYVFTQAKNGGWSQAGEVTGPTGSGVFGDTVDVVPGSNQVLVGAPTTGGAAANYAGAVYALGTNLLHRWVVSTQLASPKNSALLGAAIAATKSLLLVGAPSDSSLAQPARVAIYTAGIGTTWKLTSTTITEANPNPAFDNFGYSLALTGTTAVVGAYKRNSTGTVYLYQG